MAAPEQTQLYLITPPTFDLKAFPDDLARVLDAAPVACLRLALATTDADIQARAADALRPVAHERDIPIVIADHAVLAERHGLDGVHLTAPGTNIRTLRKELGKDAIIGAFCGTSRHDGLNVGEAGADYIAFGPVGTADLGAGARADIELFSWWSEMVELPVVAEGALDDDALRRVAPIADFVALGDEVWGAETPAARLAAVPALLG